MPKVVFFYPCDLKQSAGYFFIRCRSVGWGGVFPLSLSCGQGVPCLVYPAPIVVLCVPATTHRAKPQKR